MDAHTNLGLYRSNQLNHAPRHTSADDGALVDFREAIDGTPTAAAIIGVGALAMLIALKAFGFRFAFGVNVGR